MTSTWQTHDMCNIIIYLAFTKYYHVLARSQIPQNAYKNNSNSTTGPILYGEVESLQKLTPSNFPVCFCLSLSNGSQKRETRNGDDRSRLWTPPPPCLVSGYSCALPWLGCFLGDLSFMASAITKLCKYHFTSSSQDEMNSFPEGLVLTLISLPK